MVAVTGWITWPLPMPVATMPKDPCKFGLVRVERCSGFPYAWEWRGSHVSGVETVGRGGQAEPV
jgi:hypothetical protein